MIEPKIYKVFCIIVRNGHHAIYTCDLVFKDGVPHVVFQWIDNVPDVMSDALDPQYLEKLDNFGECDYSYRFPIVDPR